MWGEKGGRIRNWKNELLETYFPSCQPVNIERGSGLHYGRIGKGVSEKNFLLAYEYTSQGWKDKEEQIKK